MRNAEYGGLGWDLGGRKFQVQELGAGVWFYVMLS